MITDMYNKKKKGLGQSGEAFRSIQTPRKLLEASQGEQSANPRSRKLSRRPSNINVPEGPRKSLLAAPDEVKIVLTPLRGPATTSVKTGTIAPFLKPGPASSLNLQTPGDVVRVALKDIDKHQSPSLYGEMFNQFDDQSAENDNAGRKSAVELNHISTSNTNDITRNAGSLGTIHNISLRVSSNKSEVPRNLPSNLLGAHLPQVKDLKIPEREPEMSKNLSAEPIVLLKTNRSRLQPNDLKNMKGDGPLAPLTSRSMAGALPKTGLAEVSTQPSTFRGQPSNSISLQPVHNSQSQQLVRFPAIRSSNVQSTKRI